MYLPSLAEVGISPADSCGMIPCEAGTRKSMLSTIIMAKKQVVGIYSVNQRSSRQPEEF